MDIQFDEIEIFSPKVEAAWGTLQAQYANRISSAELDHLFARFVFGLTSPAYGEGEPAFHFDLCSALVAANLPPDRLHAALRTVPKPSQPWVASAYQLIEKHGAKIGSSLQDGTATQTGNPE